MQMLNTLDCVREKGLDATKLDYWSRDNDFDILHLWGVSQHNFHIINWAKKSNKYIVATVLLPYFDTFRSKLSYWKHSLTSLHEQTLYYYNLIDKFVVLNDVQSKILENFYNIPSHKISIIPNIVEENYFELPKFNFSDKYNFSDFILCTGNISRRKNQYNLAIACVNAKFNLLLIGNILQGEEEYAIKLNHLISNNSNILWIKELPKGSDDLVSAYYSAMAFALPSLEETQPISLLEATAAQKPILTLNRAYSKQKFYINAVRADSSDFLSIERNLLNLINSKNINPHIEECHSYNVASAYLNVYKSFKIK
jgi:glycosyltransferase involved in cell wall biosynthesis